MDERVLTLLNSGTTIDAMARRCVEAEAERDGLREFAQSFLSWVDNDAPVEEWDGGSLGYEVGGLYSMAKDALERHP